MTGWRTIDQDYAWHGVVMFQERRREEMADNPDVVGVGRVPRIGMGRTLAEVWADEALDRKPPAPDKPR